MSYTKNIWVDQNVQRPKTYEMTNNTDGSVTLTDSFGVVTEIGTPVNAVNMNHIEDGIYNNDANITTIKSKIPSNASSSNKMVTQADLALKANLTDLDAKADKTQLHALKSYEDAGELLTDSEGLADVKSYAHSTFNISKFTVTGNPTISDDGVVSSPTTGNFIKTSGTINFSTATTWEVSIKFTTPTTAVRTYIFSGVTNLYIAVLMDTDRKIKVSLGNGSSYFVSSASSSTVLDLNTEYEIVLRKGLANYGIIINGVSETLAPITSGNVGNTAVQIGVDRLTGVSTATDAKFDAKWFYVKINEYPYTSGNKTGVDTYTIDGSTVTIPYTLSKTGSKIADSVYRESVNDMYNQFGYAPYYTLSNTGFTLPQGEIYGMIELNTTKLNAAVSSLETDLNGKANVDLSNCTKPYIVETYQNGANGYITYSDKTCLQWIRSTRTGNENTVTLLKPYANTNYIRVMSDVLDSGQAAYSSHVLATNITASSFTYYQTHAFIGTTDWMTIGKIA